MAIIRNPVVWGWDQIKGAALAVDAAGHVDHRGRDARPAVRRIGGADLRDVLGRGFADFRADPTHYVFLCAIYPIVGLILWKLVAGGEVFHLAFPLAAGFALIGPFAAIGLYELSRRREQGMEIHWWDAFQVFRSPSIGAIMKLGVLLAAIFVVWLVAAEFIYRFTVGAEAPATAGQFLLDVFTTWRGWVLIVFGNGVGFLFAVVVLTISAVSFPLLVDRDASVETAVRTSVAAVRANPATMALWGLIVAAGLVIGSIPFLLGLAVVMPVLGHATWHLYRRVVTFSPRP